jgi:hypothetical protein
MPDHIGLSRAEFDRILADILDGLTREDLLAIPGAYEVFSEHFNNEVLNRWAEETIDLETARDAAWAAAKAGC